MKKVLSILLILCSVFLLASCGKTTSVTTKAPVTTHRTTKKPAATLPSVTEYLDEDSVMIHYKRSDSQYTVWSLWLWAANADGAKYDFNYQDDFGAIAYYPLSRFSLNTSGTLGFIIAKNPGTTWDAKDTNDDRFLDFTTFKQDENKIFHVYIFQNDKNVYATSDKKILDDITSLSFKTRTKVSLTTTNPINKFEIFKNGEILDTVELSNVKSYEYNFSDTEVFSFENSYSAQVTFTESKQSISKSIALNTLFDEEFDSEYYYDGELGAIYTSESTEFKVWSPVSNKIVLNIYENGTPKAVSESLGDDAKLHSIEMTRGEKGVFSATVEGDFEGKYYTYTVFNSSNPIGHEIVDPYAKSAGVNGLRGMIVDFSKTNPEGWDDISALPIERTALTVYELHVADLTSSSTWGGTSANQKKYLGLIEEGTTYTSKDVTVTTGFDHIKELGVNAVQLLPIFDQANDEVNVTFNWGYNPLNYNVLEGCYSSDPYDGYKRIIEFKQVVKAFNESGINIIMDVVYNHVNGAINSNFDVLMPGYYYRYNANGALYNGSGCGNETASDKLMFRKFMVDSVTFWLSEYKLGGFRFDLMGLHDLDTMALIADECEKVNPNVVIYGEPWTGGTSGLTTSKQAIQANEPKFDGYGAFNDKIRDELVKGGLASKSDLSWISNTKSALATNFDNLLGGIKGLTMNSKSKLGGPLQTVNYATCHDNYTLVDRFDAAGVKDGALKKKMAMLANSIILTSQGTSFILSGEEFLRSKQGNSNSYNASYQVNELNYGFKITNNDIFENYKKLIYLKQHLDGLHITTGNEDLEVLINETNNVITYHLTDTTNSLDYIVIHANGLDKAHSVDLTGYTLYLDTLGLHTDETLGEVSVQPFETIIAYKSVTE